MGATLLGRIVVAVADPDVRALLAFHLSWAGHQVLSVADAAEVVGELTQRPPALVLLGVQAHGDAGLRAVESLRAALPVSGTLIVCVDPASNRSLRPAAFSLGADDYLLGPVDPEDTLARIAALLRRVRPTQPGVTVRIVGPIRIDAEAHEVTVHGVPVELTPTEFQILSVLASRPGVLHTKRELLAAIGRGDATTKRAVDMQVFRLRGKLGEAGALIETVRGLGYRVPALRADRRR